MQTAPGSTRSTLKPAVGWIDADVLFERWQEQGDQAARAELIRRFMPLARKLARRYTGAHEPFDDLLQVATVGLVKAVDGFDRSRGSAFSSYAVPTIVGELKRYFRDLGWSVHVPRGAQELALRVENAQQELVGRLGRGPTVNELAEYLELSIEDVVDALEAAAGHHSVSLDTPREGAEGDAGTLADLFGAEDGRFELVEASLTIARAARYLSFRERRVLELRFAGDLTQTQIAAEVGVSQMQVSRILRTALEKLRDLTA
jgi:RNA polymerase sigma-B factor